MKGRFGFSRWAIAMVVICTIAVGISAMAQTSKKQPGLKPQAQPNPRFRALPGAGQLVLLKYEGQLIDCWDQPLGGAQVMLRDVKTGHSYTATTDEKGVFRFQGIKPGTYRLTASHPSFGASCFFPPDGVIVTNRIQPLKVPPS